MSKTRSPSVLTTRRSSQFRFWQYLTRGLIWHNLPLGPQFILVWLWNQAQIPSWNQPVLSNEGKVSFSRKQLGLRWGSNSIQIHYESDTLPNATCRQYECWVVNGVLILARTVSQIQFTSALLELCILKYIWWLQKMSLFGEAYF